MTQQNYNLLELKRPCPHRGEHIHETYVVKESGCCKGKKKTSCSKFFCKYYKREMTTSGTSPCWSCGVWKQELNK